MVSLEHQRFWEPFKGPSRVCSDNGPGDDASGIHGQSITHVEKCETNGYALWKHRPLDGNEMEDLGTYGYL